MFVRTGNILRVKGDTYHAMECFRSAYAISSSNPDVLLNMARILVNLNFMKDAIYLLEHSLDNQPIERTTWLQHFALGQLLEKNGDIARACSHYEMTLVQNPTFHPAHFKMQRLSRSVPTPSETNLYTVIIISLLCILIVLYLHFSIIKEPAEANSKYNYMRTGFFKKYRR